MALLNPREAAQKVGVSTSTIRRRLKQDRYDNRAVLIGRRWKIPDDALMASPVERTGEHQSSPRWIKPPTPGSGWRLVDHEMMAAFIERVIEEIRPDYIVVGVRKGERIVSVLGLIPKRYRSSVYHQEYFELIPKEDCKQLLKNRRVLLLDDTIQRGRHLNLVKHWFEDIGENTQVHVACLFMRIECRNNGDLEIPDVVVYRELDDPNYRLAMAELSRFHRSLWPLDENHPMLWTTLSGPLTDQGVERALCRLGRLLELPSPIEDADVRILVVDQIKTPTWRSLDLPRIARDWPNRKLRVIWDKGRRQLLLAGIWFPSLQASNRWLKNSFASINATPWFSYMSIKDATSWEATDAIQKAKCIFNAWAIYCGTALVSAAIVELMHENPEALPSRAEDWRIEKDDFTRSFGKLSAEQIALAMDAEVARAVQLGKISPPSMSQMPLNEVGVLRLINDATPIHAHVRPFVQLLSQKTTEWESTSDADETFKGIDYESLREELGTDLSLQIDLALDYGYGKPDIRVIVNDDAVEVKRTFKSTEKRGETELIEDRLISTISLMCHAFESHNPGEPLESTVFNKLLVNLQANLTQGAVNPSGTRGIDHILVHERPMRFGPMAYTPYILTPGLQIPVASYLASNGIIKPVFDDGLPRPIVLEKPLNPSQIPTLIGELHDAWADASERIKSDIEFLCNLTGAKLGAHIPSRGNLLTALAASSAQVRYVHYCGVVVQMWCASVEKTLKRLREIIETGETKLKALPEIESMAQTEGSIHSKTNWYLGLERWRKAIETMLIKNDHIMTRRRLLSRIESRPVLDPASASGFMIAIEPMLRRFGVVVRAVATKAGLVQGIPSVQVTGDKPCSRFDPWDTEHELCNFAEMSIALRSQGPMEMEAVTEAIDHIGQLDGKAIDASTISSLFQIWDVVKDVVNRLKRDGD